jgi:uncharacterized membrane protein YbhN (UPF0104 family)
VLGVQVVASVFLFTPGGAGVQQALLVTIFARSADQSTVAAFSVGRQIAMAVVSGVLGFGALVVILRLRSFRDVIRRGREERRQEVGKPDLGPPRPEPG